MKAANTFRKVRRPVLRLSQTLRHRAEDIGLLPATDAYTRFVCITMARTGSTLLVKTLNNHKGILAYAEILKTPEHYPTDIHAFENSERLYKTDPATFLRQQVFRKYPPNVAAVGFKVFYYHAPRSTEWGQAVWDYLVGETGIRVLHLKRQNLLECLVSRQIAARTDEWGYQGYTDRSVSAGSVEIDYQEALDFFTRVRAYEEQYDEMFAQHPKMTLLYEELNQDRAGQMLRIQEFLGVPSMDLDAGTQKRPGKSLASQIRNYAELKARFQGLPWEDFFYE